MSKTEPLVYKNLFLRHIWSFLESITSHLEEPQRGHVIAVSGGRDSMALLWTAFTLSQQKKVRKIRAVFIHHHTRKGQDLDQELVEKFCSEKKINLKILHAKGLEYSDSNFEERARILRKKLLKAEIKNNELLWMGHHLDDSFEWNLMQKFRSSHLKSSLGIPVRSGPVVRPFLSVTRRQISKLVRDQNIPYHEDPTNLDFKHDRNYIRHQVVPAIRKRYPKYLKFYAHKSNALAKILKLSVFKKNTNTRIFKFQEGAVILGNEFSEIEIQELIHSYSTAMRGKLITPINRMLKAISDGKKGPFQFSGGIEICYSYHQLTLYPQKLCNYDFKLSQKLSERAFNIPALVRTYSLNELEHAWQELLASHDAIFHMPGLVLVFESESFCKTLKTSVYDPLFPCVSQLAQNEKWHFISFAKCLDVWKHNHKKLPERLRLLPLNVLL